MIEVKFTGESPIKVMTEAAVFGFTILSNDLVGFYATQEFDAIRADIAEKKGEPQTTIPAKAPVDATPAKKPAKEENKPQPTEYTAEQVRAEAVKVARAKGRDKVKALTSEFGADTVQEIPADRYSEFMERLEQL